MSSGIPGRVIDFMKVPLELKNSPQSINLRYAWSKDDKRIIVSINPKTGRKAQKNNSETGPTFSRNGEILEGFRARDRPK